MLHFLQYGVSYEQKDCDLARKYWQDALRVQEQTGNLALQARSLHHLAELTHTELQRQEASLRHDLADFDAKAINYGRADGQAQNRIFDQLKSRRDELGLRIRDLQTRLNGAENQTDRAIEILSSLKVYPNLHYSVLCNCASILETHARWVPLSERQALTNRAIKRLENAVQLAEGPRQMTLGGDLAQAEFFSHYSTAFERLVALYVARGTPNDLDQALKYAEQARNRTFLDQVIQAGGDVWSQIKVKQPELVYERQKVMTDYAEFSARLRLQQSNTKEDEKKLEEIRQRWTNVEGKIRRIMVGSEHRPIELTTGELVRKTLVKPDNVVLYYFIGQTSSHLFVLNNSQGIRHFRLQLGAGMQRSLGMSSDSVCSSILKRLFDDYRTLILPEHSSDPQSQAQSQAATKSISGTESATNQDRPPIISLSHGPSLTDMLVPAEVRTIIADENPAYVLVVPDGPLHELPLEALPVNESNSEFLFDHFRPIAYAPSAHILAAVSRPNDALSAKTTMLIVGDTVPRLEVAAEGISREDPIQLASITRGRETRRSGYGKLPFSGIECDEVKAAMSSVFRGELLDLRSSQTTEQRVKAAMSSDGRRIACLLFSCHGFTDLDDDTNQLFGGLVLSPPASGSSTSSTDDGFLYLPEIHQLPLRGCELAVLSACKTNIGKQRPLETGSTMARSFIIAGARRVVCTQWAVNDQSTLSLVTRFFENIASQSKGERDEINLADALSQARKQVRRTYSLPRHWAPFVLIGPPIVKKDQLLGSAN
jgi:CHAT domain-containing protein